MKKYYYGLKDGRKHFPKGREICEDINHVYEGLKYGYIDKQDIIDANRIIVEMVASKKSGYRWCLYYNDFPDECGNHCKDYTPINGKNGICKYFTWGLIETGAKWLVIGEYKYKKLSGRRK